MSRLFVIVLVIFSLISAAEQLKPEDAKLIEKAGIPIYEDVVFAIGNKDVGFRFATSSKVEDVQQWYQKQLPKWSLFNKYGSWILYNGEPDKGLSEIMSVNQVSVSLNEKLPEWYTMDKKMTTEIVIMVVE